MLKFATVTLPADPTMVAPDGSSVRVLLTLTGGSMAHFSLAPGQVSRAVVHRTVEEIWYVVNGRGAMWRCHGEHEAIVPLKPGVSLTIPVGTRFQFCADAGVLLSAIAVTMPPWPDNGEAELVDGPWEASVG